jgi:hypothetical protein
MFGIFFGIYYIFPIDNHYKTLYTVSKETFYRKAETMPEDDAVKITTVQIDIDTRDMLRELAASDLRTIYGELRWIIRQQHYERFGKPAGSAEQVQTEQVKN